MIGVTQHSADLWREHAQKACSTLVHSNPIARHHHLPSPQLTLPTSLAAVGLRFAIAIAIAILLYMSCLVLASNDATLIGACPASQSHPAPIPDRGALASIYLLGAGAFLILQIQTSNTCPTTPLLFGLTYFLCSIAESTPNSLIRILESCHHADC
jgi:hypothetical protein